MKKHPWAYLVAVVLIGLFFAQSVGNLAAQSPVVDEPSHITRAIVYWRVGDLRLQLGHPPLIHALAGLPLLLEPGLPRPESLPGWQDPFDRETLAGHMLWDVGRPTDRMVFLARWPVLMLAILLGALIFRWAGERFGVRAAVVGLFVFAFDPNLLAHSVLTTTDLGVVFFILLAVYSFDRWTRRPSRKWLVMAGITFGLAVAAKFPAVILLPVLAVLAFVSGWRARRRAEGLVWFRRTAVALAAIFAIAAVIVWAVYRFEVGPWQPNSISVPAPTFWNGLLRVKERDEEGRMAFLLGKMSPRGWWYYFPVALAVKTPLPTLLLLVAAMVGEAISIYHLWKRRETSQLERRVWTVLTLLLLPVLYFGVSMQSSLDLGYRYILPALPFLFIWIADGGLRMADWGWRILAFHPPSFDRQTQASNLQSLFSRSKFNTWHVILGLLGAWLVAEAVLSYPYHLAYFNEIAGGPDNGYKLLADSNLDWGQDIKRLKAWLDQNHVGEAHLVVFTGSVPERYGIQTLPMPGPYEPPDAHGFQRFAPAPGVYVISASAWQGLRFENPDTFDWFRRQKPVARIGHSLFVYNVLATPATEKWVGVCYAPDGPIDGNGLTAGFGRTDMRSIFFDCRDAWVYVHNGGPGYYVVPARGDPTIADAMMLSHGTPIYHDRGDPVMPKDAPGFTLYRWDGEADALARLAALPQPPGGAFDFGPASLVGYELDPGPFTPGSTLHLTTWWRANSPGEASLSAYVHVMDGERLVSGGGDGMDVPPQMWQTGDVIVQQHTLKLLSDLAPGDYTLHVGLYHAPDGPRLPLQINGRAGDTHPRLATLQVVGK